MQKFLCYTLTFLAVLFGLSGPTLQAQEIDFHCRHHDGKSRDNYFGIVRLRPIAVFDCDNSALAVLAEGGYNAYRGNGTYGFIINQNHRFKIGGEWLGQRLHYKFASGQIHRWNRQSAFGGKYQYLFDCPSLCFNGLQFGLGYSHALGRSLQEVICIRHNAILFRRLSDSVFWNFDAGLIVAPWECGNMVLSLTYDNIRYHRQHRSSKRLSGVGFSFDYTQYLWGDLSIDFKAQFRRPYNYLELMLNWTERTECGDCTFGIFANRVFGKAKLPSSTAAGIELRYAFGIDTSNCLWNAGNQCDPENNCPYVTNLCWFDSTELAAWVADPAIYRPQVLSVADHRFRENVE